MPGRSEPKSCIALLRGINLGPRNRIAMADLRGLVRALGAEDVRTYVQSGNVVFRSELAPAELEGSLARSIRRELRLDVVALVRTAEQLTAIAAANPFLNVDPAKLHVTFMASAPEPERVRRLADADFAPDELLVTADAVYLHCPDGYGRTKLGNTFLERQLAVAATTRNWRTVTALTELAGG
jgi:uncharacterized protein (DUF1697 family)